jgi:hypothetical protein
MNYQPELDVLNELGPELSSRYLQLIGIVQWAIELGHINIYHEVSLLSQYQANPRVGHLEALYHVFAYMKSHLDTARLNRRYVAMVLPPMPVKRDWRLYNMGQCMVECFTMASCIFTNIQTTCGDQMNCDVASV